MSFDRDKIGVVIVWAVIIVGAAIFLASAVVADYSRNAQEKQTLISTMETQVVRWEETVAEFASRLDKPDAEFPAGMTRQDYKDKVEQMRQFLADVKEVVERTRDAETGYAWYQQKEKFTSQWEDLRLDFDTMRAILY